MRRSPLDFDDLLRQAQRPVLGHLIRLTGSLHDAQDLMQSANVTAISKRDSFAAGTNFVAWLRQIAVNHFQNHLRKETSQGRVGLVDDELLELIEQRYRQRAEQEQREIDSQRLMSCLQQLPPHQRELMTQFYFDGKTLSQLAVATGRKANAIGQTLYRARLSMSQCMGRSPEQREATKSNRDSATLDRSLPT